MFKNLVVCFMLMSCCGMQSVFANTATHSSEHKPHPAAKLSQQSVDINRATLVELTSLKGVGVKKAQRIVAYRQSHGKFKALSGLSSVNGIGMKTIALIQKHNPGRLVL